MKHEKDYRAQEALPFYNSIAWQNCRRAYASARSHLCERCLSQGIIKRGEIVHHIRPLNSQNINDPEISLNWNNLMLVCRKCHTEIHKGKRFTVDSDGKITAVDTPPC